MVFFHSPITQKADSFGRRMLKNKRGALTGEIFHLGAPFLLRVPNIAQPGQDTVTNSVGSQLYRLINIILLDFPAKITQTGISSIFLRLRITIEHEGSPHSLFGR